QLWRGLDGACAWVPSLTSNGADAGTLSWRMGPVNHPHDRGVIRTTEENRCVVGTYLGRRKHADLDQHRQHALLRPVLDRQSVSRRRCATSPWRRTSPPLTYAVNVLCREYGADVRRGSFRRKRRLDRTPHRRRQDDE